MKTPKRHYKAPANQLAQDIEPDFFEADYNKQEARWKRKNRVAQLKRSLERYKDGTNLPFYCHEMHAYKRLQELKYPGKKATAEDWDIHRRFLKTIHCHIWQAIHQAEREQEQAKRKEEE